MKSALCRAALFVSVPVMLVILADLLLAVFYQGAQPEYLRQQMLAVHGIFYIAVFLLSGLGAFVAFLLGRSRTPSYKAVLLAALLFSVASFFAVVIAFGLGGPIALGAWLFLGSVLFATSTLPFAGHNGG